MRLRSLILGLVTVVLATKMALALPLAEVNGKVLTAEEFKALTDEIKSSYPDLVLTDDQKKELLNSWVKEEVLAQEAVKQGLEKSDNAKTRIEESRRQVLARIVLEKQILGSVSVTDKEIQDYYDNNRATFKSTDPRIHARHILVKTEDEAKKIASEIKKGGDFAKLAAQYSQDPGSKNKGGDLGFFSRDEMVSKEFDDAAFTLKKGQTSPPVHTKYGYHLIQVVEKKVSETKGFDEVKDLIKRELLKKKRGEALESYLDKLKSNDKIEVREELLKDVKL